MRYAASKSGLLVINSWFNLKGHFLFLGVGVFFGEGDGIFSKVSPGRVCLHSHLCPSPIRTISLPMKCLGCFTLKLSRTFYVMFWCGCRKLIPADREIFLKKSFHFQTMSVNWLPWPLPHFWDSPHRAGVKETGWK